MKPDGYDPMAVKYNGFPDRVRSIPVPAPLFGQLLEQIDDHAELKCLLRVIWLLQQKKGYPRFVTHSEALADRTLATALDSDSDTISNALEACVRRGTLAMAIIGNEVKEERLYALNTSRDRQALARAASDAFVVGHSQTEPIPEPWDPSIERPNIFALYEANIGMLSPMIADELKQAETLYPIEWIEDAFREATLQNVRNWRYIVRILESWEREGRNRGQGDGKSRGHSPKASRY